jgi:hypothetical protein
MMKSRSGPAGRYTWRGSESGAGLRLGIQDLSLEYTSFIVIPVLSNCGDMPELLPGRQAKPVENGAACTSEDIDVLDLQAKNHSI